MIIKKNITKIILTICLLTTIIFSGCSNQDAQILQKEKLTQNIDIKKDENIKDIKIENQKINQELDERTIILLESRNPELLDKYNNEEISKDEVLKELELMKSNQKRR